MISFKIYLIFAYIMIFFPQNLFYIEIFLITYYMIILFFSLYFLHYFSSCFFFIIIYNQSETSIYYLSITKKLLKEERYIFNLKTRILKYIVNLRIILSFILQLINNKKINKNYVKKRWYKISIVNFLKIGNLPRMIIFFIF